MPLTVVRDQALAGPQQQVHLVASSLDEFDGPGVRDALRGLAVDLHDLISHLSATVSLQFQVTLYLYFFLIKSRRSVKTCSTGSTRAGRYQSASGSSSDFLL